MKLDLYVLVIKRLHKDFQELKSALSLVEVEMFLFYVVSLHLTTGWSLYQLKTY
jgi:hypothetical protein